MHCVATAVLLGLLASAGGFLGQPIIHEVGLTLAMIIGAFALGRGILEHGFMLPSAVGALGLGVMAGALSLPDGGTSRSTRSLGVLILALGPSAEHASPATKLSRLPGGWAVYRGSAHMGRHDHQLHEGEVAEERGARAADRAGRAMDDMRAAVFEALASFDKPASAYDIAERSRRRRAAASPPTASIASSTCSSAPISPAGSRAPTPMSPTQHPDCLHDCIFLICDNCGQAVHIDDDSLTSGVRAAARAPASPRRAR